MFSLSNFLSLFIPKGARFLCVQGLLEIAPFSYFFRRPSAFTKKAKQIVQTSRSTFDRVWKHIGRIYVYIYHTKYNLPYFLHALIKWDHLNNIEGSGDASCVKPISKHVSLYSPFSRESHRGTIIHLIIPNTPSQAVLVPLSPRFCSNMSHF